MDRRAIWESDRPQIADFIAQEWGSDFVMSRGKKFYPHQQDGFIEWREGRIVGLLTYNCNGDEMELLTLNRTIRGEGIGSALSLMAIQKARELNLKRVWLTTTNDSLQVFALYQRLGFRFAAINHGAVDEARKVKPQIPDVGYKGIPVHDEIILDLNLEPSI